VCAADSQLVLPQAQNHSSFTVVDGQLVPRAYKARGHGPDALRKRRRDEPAAATPSPRARRPRRAVDYAAMEDPDFEP